MQKTRKEVEEAVKEGEAATEEMQNSSTNKLVGFCPDFRTFSQV